MTGTKVQVLGETHVAPESRDAERADPDVSAHTVPPAHDVVEWSGVVLRGSYELVRKLGRGGMGEVWLGNHLALGTKVAVKMIHPALATLEDEARRFVHEAHALSLLTHPNVVRVLDVVREHNTMFIVMEFLDGESLGAQLERAPKPPPIAYAVDVITQIAEALEAVHALGIVHRDLKPDNVFVTQDVRGRARIKVVDFGLAHVDDPRDERPLTNTGTLAGTPPYMSPEQCRSLRVGPSADLYSLGCILTELLQLRPPFSAATSVDLIARHLFTPPPPLARAPDAEPVPPLLEQLRLDLLAKTPERRPASARDLLDRLEQAMDPVRAASLLPDRSNAHGAPRDRRSASLPPPSLWRDMPRAGVVRIERLGVGALDQEISTAIESRDYLCQTDAARATEPADVIILDAPSVADAEAWLANLSCQPAERSSDEWRVGLRQPRPKAEGEANGGAKPPTIVCVQSSDVATLSRLVAAGAFSVLLHPVGADTLLAKIDACMRRRRARPSP